MLLSLKHIGKLNHTTTKLIMVHPQCICEINKLYSSTFFNVLIQTQWCYSLYGMVADHFANHDLPPQCSTCEEKSHIAWIPKYYKVYEREGTLNSIASFWG